MNRKKLNCENGKFMVLSQKLVQ